MGAALIVTATGVAVFLMNRATSSPVPDLASPSGASLASRHTSTPAQATVGSTPAASVQPAAAAPEGARAAGATYFIDPDTKQPHEPSAEEMQALQAAGGTTGVEAAPQPLIGVNGVPGLRLTDEQMIYTVASKNADGKVSIQHAAGKSEALQKLQTQSTRSVAAVKEQ
jgi:hypothetical protein